MRGRLAAVVAVTALALTLASSALAFDCLRMSSSLQGLKQSTKSGNWLLFDLGSAAGVQQTFAVIVGEELPAEVASCIAAEYAEYDVTPYFALGVGVAGGKNENGGGTGVLAWRNKNGEVLGNLKGIDHLEASPVGAALFGSLGACGIDVEQE
ncbi:MAG: hypothetical protein ACR2GT_13010 [Gaiellaceae bacterium]